MLGVQILDALPVGKAPDPSGMPARYLLCSRRRSREIPMPSTREPRTENIWKCWWNGMCGGQSGSGCKRRARGKNSLDRAFPAFRKQKLFLKAGILE